MEDKQVKPGEGTLILSPLRDQFAMAALTGLIVTNKDLYPTAIDAAVVAYAIADAMLAERDKVKP